MLSPGPMHPLRVPLLLAALLAAAPALAQPGIVLFPAVGQPTGVTVQGRVYKDAASGGSSVLSRNLRRLTASDWEGAPVEVSWAGQVVQTRAGEDGVFSADFHLPAAHAVPPGIAEVRATVPGATARGAVRVLDPKAPFLVVSDFDDTLAVTNVLDRRALVKSAFFEDGTTQPAVPGMSAFYACLVDSQQPTPGLAVVSGSPHQWAPRIEKFLVRNAFPFAGLYLRDLGLDTLHDYKQPVIRRLLKELPQKVILVGDSGEHDPEVYAQIRKEFPDRVLAVYIHDVGRAEDPSRFAGMVLFKDAREAAADAAARGFLSPGCLERAFGTEEK